MALSRIWSAFIIIALIVAGSEFLLNPSRDDIFGRLVTGTSKDEFSYVAIGDATKYGRFSIDSFATEMQPFGFRRLDKVSDNTKYIVTDNIHADTVRQLMAQYPSVRPVEYSYILGKKQKPVDGIIATCTSAVNICIGLIGI